MIHLPRLGRVPAEPILAPEALAFQDDLDALVAEPSPRLLRLWPWLAGALIVGLLLVAAVARIDIVVIATGRLTPDVPPVVLQPIDRAVLRELRVRAGDVVAEGQIVAVLDQTFTTADRAALEAQRRALAAQQARLDAELGGTPMAPEPGPEGALQGRVLAQRQAFHTARRAALTADLTALDTALAAERRAGSGVAQHLAIAREIEEMRGRLAETQVGSHLNVLIAKATRLEAEQALNRHTARLDELTQQAAARRADLDAFLRDWERLTLEDLARVRAERARLDEQLAKAARLDALTLMRAPRAGVVLETAKRAPGSLVREGEAVVVLVPLGVPLIAEIGLRSADIGRLRPGDVAGLKIDSFPWRRHGTLPGRLRAISRESYPAGPEAGGGAVALHRGQVALDLPLPPGLALVPGMTLTAEINIGTRSVLDFFLEPLLRGLTESLREP